ncbi:MAG: PBECR2 nuclease fold domain-containing protein [Bacteroidales bacterium]
MVNTPIGEVKMGENQITKLARQGREGKLGIINPTLTNPDVIIEDKSKAKDGQITERDSSYIFAKSFQKPDGSRYYCFTSVTESKGNKEVVISN